MARYNCKKLYYKHGDNKNSELVIFLLGNLLYLVNSTFISKNLKHGHVTLFVRCLSVKDIFLEKIVTLRFEKN